jgi:hypothetical protein
LVCTDIAFHHAAGDGESEDLSAYLAHPVRRFECGACLDALHGDQDVAGLDGRDWQGAKVGKQILVEPVRSMPSASWALA